MDDQSHLFIVGASSVTEFTVESIRFLPD